MVNHTAGGYLFYQSPEHHRITRFRPNGVPMDRPGHYLYLRDDETGEYWSVSWQPCGGPLKDYRCRHGLSYSVYECVRGGIRAAQTLFIPRGGERGAVGPGPGKHLGPSPFAERVLQIGRASCRERV